jgi:cytochrome P450
MLVSVPDVRVKHADLTTKGLPHATSADDWYNGYFIPKGSTIIMLAWTREHDDVQMPDHETVKPERFMKDGKVDPQVPIYTFGVGRRICPGQTLVFVFDHRFWLTL